MRGRQQGWVGREHHGRVALQHCDVGHQRADQHEPELGPAPTGRSNPRIEQYGGCEIQHRHLEENDPDQQDVEAVRRQREVEPVGREQVHGGPAGERDREPEQAADEQEHHGNDGVRLDQIFRGPVDLQTGRRAGAKVGCSCHDGPLICYRRRRCGRSSCDARNRSTRCRRCRTGPSGSASSSRPTRIPGAPGD